MKRIVLILLIAGMLTLLSSCAGNDAAVQRQIGGRSFVWEKEGFGGSFTLTLHNDGSYVYSVGAFSSYLAIGDWSVNDGVLTLSEKTMPDTLFRFSVRNGELIFISDGSSRFMHVTVEDGDRFLPIKSK